MIKKLLLSTSLLAFIAVSAYAKEGIKYYNIEGDVTEKFYKMMKEELPKIGFSTTDPHKKINDVYKKKYGKSVLDTLNFFTIVHEKKLKKLLEIEPRLAGFNPFNLSLYKAKEDKFSHVGHLTPETILDILKIEDVKVRDAYKALFPDLDAMIEKTMGNNISYVEYDALPEDTMMNFEIDFERPDDLDDFIDEFQEKFEESFEAKEYIIAGYQNFKEAYESTDDKFATYDAFWTYSLCHFKFSYSIFDNEKARSDASIFAPCTMYMYIKKDSNTLVVGMPKLANWQAVNKIVMPSRVDFIKQLDTEIPEIMVKTLAAKEIKSDLGSDTQSTDNKKDSLSSATSNKERIALLKSYIEVLQKELNKLEGK